MIDTLEVIYDLSKKHGKYPPDAYILIYEVLDYVALNAVRRHLTGKELALSAFVYSLQKYGMLAKVVWDSLSIQSSEDLGQIVYHLVEAGLLQKQEEDSIEDFNGLYTSQDFLDTKMSVIGEREKWVHVSDKEKGLTLQYVPPEKLGLSENKN